MKQHKWTFLYVPSSEGGVRTVHLDKRLVGVLGGVLLFFLVGVSLLCASHVRQKVMLRGVSEREQEIQGLRGKISELEDAVHNYREQMAVNLRLQERASLLAGLGPLDESSLELGGVGGREPEAFPVELGSVDELTRERIGELRDQLRKLLHQARFQREGYQQVLKVLHEDQKLRDSTPSVRPLLENDGYVSSRYGRRVDPFTGQLVFHRGLDFSAAQGTPVLATAAGRVSRAARHGSLGNLVEVDHGNGVVTRYGHLQEFNVRKGQWISRGEAIGSVGNTGRSTAPHVHYEVIREGRTENPWLYIVRD